MLIILINIIILVISFNLNNPNLLKSKRINIFYMNDELNIDVTPTDDDIVNGVGGSGEVLEETETGINDLGEEITPEIEADEDLIDEEEEEEEGVEMDSYDDKDEM